LPTGYGMYTLYWEIQSEDNKLPTKFIAHNHALSLWTKTLFQLY